VPLIGWLGACFAFPARRLEQHREAEGSCPALFYIGIRLRLRLETNYGGGL
jgi:hypothetical protein